MAILSTDAIVLQVRDYLESSRIVRMVTREAGVLSAIAKGARRTRARTGSALDLFAEGVAHLYIKPTRDLQTLASFDGGRGRPALGEQLERFLAANAVAEFTLRVLHEEPNVPAYDALLTTLDAIAGVPTPEVDAAALAGIWHMVETLGFAPALDVCANCNAAIGPDDEPVRFVMQTGGALCPRCARLAVPGRSLPADARGAIGIWLAGERGPLPAPDAIRAHQRLLREFLREHVTGERPLHSWDVWERGWAI